MGRRYGKFFESIGKMAKINWETVRQVVHDHTEVLCQHFFPAGKKVGLQWVVGDVNGDPGQSLRIELEGEKAGLFYDFATGAGDDFIILVRDKTGLRRPEVAVKIGEIVGISVEEVNTYSRSTNNKGARYKTGNVKPCDWNGDYKLTVTDIDDLVGWRGYSRPFCEWAVTQQLIGRRNGNWAFPVYDNGAIVAAHVRHDKDDWRYVPKLKDLGVKMGPLVAGDIVAAEKVFSDESPWDIFAVLDKLGVQHGEQIAGIATRGASNAALVATLQITAELFAIPQNDDPGRAWVESLGTVLTREFKVITVPSSFHDVDDWLRALSDISEFVEAIRNAVLKEPRKKLSKAERSEAFGKCIKSGLKFSDIQIPPKAIIIDDWLKEGELGFIYAYRGTGKTWVTLNLCIAVAEGSAFGVWSVPVAYPVLYVDGEMSHGENVQRITALYGKLPENLHILNHEVLFHQAGQVMNLAHHEDQEILLEHCLLLKIKVLVLDNLSCLFCGMGENDADEWEKINPWLLELRRNGISPIIIHHTGNDQTRMRGTSKREDSASWVLRLDNRKDDFDKVGAHFISRFTKYRGKNALLDKEWKFESDGQGRIIVTIGSASRDDVFLQWVRDGVTRSEAIAHEMGISQGQASKIATKLIKLGKLRKSGRDYMAV